jgi:hypothetical protein
LSRRGRPGFMVVALPLRFRRRAFILHNTLVAPDTETWLLSRPSPSPLPIRGQDQYGRVFITVVIQT